MRLVFGSLNHQSFESGPSRTGVRTCGINRAPPEAGSLSLSHQRHSEVPCGAGRPNTNGEQSALGLDDSGSLDLEESGGELRK